MPPKRKAAAAAVPEQDLRRSTRRSTAAAAAAPATTKRAADGDPDSEQKSVKVRKTAGCRKKATNGNESKDTEPKPKEEAKPVGMKSKAAGKATKAEDANGSSTSEKTYWLLKAEPESRLENGIDVRFSIDDLASKTEPEPWDGIRNYVARNNLRAIKKGDLGFFYHSSCKEPGIVGTMEIVQEHSPDLSAHDPKLPYYDASSKPEDPKWSVVHVEFRSKFAQQIGLKELREMGKPGSPLENMQLLKQSRLSVSRVSESEWNYLIGVAEERGGMTKKS